MDDASAPGTCHKHAMDIPRRKRILRGPPLALQVVGLLITGLIVAQIVTLFLTLLLPPAPGAQYRLDDIAAVLRGEESAAQQGRRLVRSIQAGPPDITGPGWLTSARSRHDLAGLLEAGEETVLLSFYTPLPFAGTAAQAPSHLAPPPPEVDAFVSPTEPLPIAIESDAGTTVRPTPINLLLAQGGPPGGGMPGGMGMPPGGGFPGGSFPGGAFPGGQFPGSSPSQDRGATHENRAPTQRSQSEQPQAPTGQERAAAPDAPTPGAATEAAPTPAPPQVSGPVDSQPPMASPAMRLPDIDQIRPLSAPAPITPQVNDRPQPEQPRSATPAPPRQPSVPPAAPVPSAPVPSVAAPVIAPTLPAQAPTAPADSSAAPALDDSQPLPGTPIPLPAQQRGLFGLAPAPFVEGDFVAAWHMPDGRWAVVQPAPESFPNSWQRRILLWFALALAIVMPLGWLFARRIVKPLHGFADAAEQLGRDPGAAILPLDGPAEVGRAANAFNLMQSRLRTFVDDRTAMIGAISHDLRTPLTRLRFRLEDIDDADMREGMIEEVEDMETMINSVLEYLRDASAPGTRERIGLGAIAEEAVEDAKMVGRQVELDLEDDALVEVDVLGIRRVLDNLIENAVKYGQRARVRISSTEGNAVAEIVDRGPGLPDTELENVFTPFYRSASALQSDKPGSGLGLAVCRSIARAHGGDVHLLNVPDGLMARVTIPLTYEAKRLKVA